MFWEIILRKAFQGFIKDPKQDRSKAAASCIGNCIGCKNGFIYNLRGSYDFVVIFEGSFEQGLVLKWQQKQVVLFVILQSVEEINMAMMLLKRWEKLQLLYKGPGQ